MLKWKPLFAGFESNRSRIKINICITEHLYIIQMLKLTGRELNDNRAPHKLFYFQLVIPDHSFSYRKNSN